MRSLRKELQARHSDNTKEGMMDGTKRRGFGSMDPAKQRWIAGLGGRAAHQKGTAHEWTSQEARDAGRKGGQAMWRMKKAAGLAARP
ncbi:MAG: hypothetical protein ACM3KM_03540 [Acidobacteriaceae bacterium]